MKSKLLLLILTFSAISGFSQTSHVVVISIDGLRPEFYIDHSYPAPNLQRAVKEGLHAKQIRSVFPSYTYPSHTAMLSGALPARSGIHYNAKPGSKDWYWFTSEIKVPVLWDELSKNGLTTSAIEWPVSVSDKITYNVPEIWDTLHPDDRITVTRKYATKGLIEDIELNATGRLDSNNMSEESYELDENAAKMAGYIFKKYKPNLLAVHLVGVDAAQHAYGRNHEVVRLALANVDHAVGVIREAIERSGVKDSTTILIVGDHGFSDMHTVIRPNLLLQKAGILDKVKFHPSGGSCFLYGDSTLTSRVADLLMRNEVSNYFKVLDKTTLKAMGADPKALLALSAKPGYVFSGSLTDNLTDSIKGGHHGYNPNLPEMMTGFIATGASINKGVIIDNMCVTDIAPIIATLLGISFDAPDGKLPKGLIQSNKTK